MNYREKYLKYKNKYLKLKKQLGGGKYEELIQEMKDKGKYDEWVKLGSFFATPSKTSGVYYYGMNGEYIQVYSVDKEYKEGDIPVFKFKANLLEGIFNGNKMVFRPDTPIEGSFSSKSLIKALQETGEETRFVFGLSPPKLKEKSELKSFTSTFNTDWENYPVFNFVKIYSNKEGIIRLNYIANITVTSIENFYIIDLNLNAINKLAVLKSDSLNVRYFLGKITTFEEFEPSNGGLFLGYESIENTGYKLDDNIINYLKIGNIITVIKNTYEFGIIYHKPKIVAFGRINKINIENGQILSILINDTIFKTPDASEIGDYVIFNGEFRLDDTEFKGPILEHKISKKREIPSFNIDIEYGQTNYKLSVNSEMLVKDVHYAINRLIDTTKPSVGFKLDIHLITKFVGKNIIMDEQRALSDYGFREGSKIVVSPKGNTGF